MNLVYSSVSSVTWTKDANLFKTLYDADNTLISQIAAVTPSYNDPYWAIQSFGQSLNAGHFETQTGRMSWWGGLAFASYLNSIHYGGSNQWRLPGASDDSQLGNNPAGNELSQLFYSELGGSANSVIPTTTTFNNLQAYAYWSGTAYAPNPIPAWFFDTATGSQGFSNLSVLGYAWVVSPGKVATVPVPAASWFMFAGLLGFFRFNRDKNKASF